MSKFQPRIKGWSLTINLSIVTISILAILLNILVLVLLHRCRWRDVFSFQLVKIIAILDLISGFKECIEFLIRYIIGNPAFYDSSWYCPVFRTASLYIPSISGFFISVLAIERYTILCRPSRLSPKVTLISVLILSAILLIPHIGSMIDGNFSPDPTGSYCLAGMSTWSKIVRYETNIIIFLPFIIITFCYLKIVSVYPNNVNIESNRFQQNVWVRALLFIFVYSLGFLPIIISILWKLLSGQRRPDIFYALIPISIVSITAFNPILVLALQYPLTKELLLMLKWRETRSPSMELISA